MKYLWIVFVVIVACAVTGIVGFWLRKSGKYERVPDFKLVERGGQPLTRKDLLGRVWVTGFVFTRCAGACPVMMSKMYGLHRAFPDVTYVAFSVDPAHDTPEVLRA